MFTWGVGRRAVEPATEQALRGEVKPLRYGHASIASFALNSALNRRRPLAMVRLLLGTNPP
jgi:hypothetical protein